MSWHNEQFVSEARHGQCYKFWWDILRTQIWYQQKLRSVPAETCSDCAEQHGS